jgi:uncharacterized protein YjbI with pentapeptide repeats
MVNEGDYTRLKGSVQGWNDWRANNSNIIPDLSMADLIEANLIEANLRGADLSEANLSWADLSEADLSEANLTRADLSQAYLSEANLNRADFSGANLSGAKVSGVDLIRANLSGADLSGADLSGAYLWGGNLIGADLSKASLRGAKVSGADLREANLRGADLNRTNLSEANLRGTYLSKANLRGADLRKADLSGADLSGADLSGADLSKTDLSKTDLSGANLSRTQALETDFSNAKFTGACLEDWNYNYGTKLNDIDCQYVYLKQNNQKRYPISEDFPPGDFTKRFQKALETVDLIFRNGVDWKAFTYSFRKIQIENESSELTIRKIEIIDDIVLVKVNISEQADKIQFESGFFKGYEFAKKELEPQYQARLCDKDKEINRLFILFNQANDKLGEVPKLMAEQPKVQQNFHASVYGVAGNVEGDFNNYLPEQKQNLAEAAADIQKIINQLAQTNPTTDAVTEAIHQEIKRNPTLKARLISALKAGVLEGLKTFVNHPLFNIPAETIKGFLEAE